MIINGLQKMTLLDYPGKLACTVFFAGCNFRCPFCHNARLVTRIQKEDEISEDEFFSFLEKRKGMLDGVCITGGEPLMQNDIYPFIQRIKDMGFLLKLDTNGSFPEKMKMLIDAGLIDKVAMDIKNCREKYNATIGIKNDILPQVEKSMDILLFGNIDYEFRTTVIKEYHTADDIEKICARIKGAKAYYIQPFTDSGNLISDLPLNPPDKDTLLKMQELARKYIPEAALRGNF